MAGVDEIEAAYERARAHLSAIPGVFAVGLGVQRTAGEPTGALALRVYVTRKRPLADLGPDERVPAEFDGIPVDVIERDRPTPTDDPADETFDDDCPALNPQPLQPGEKLPTTRHTTLVGGIRMEREGAGGSGTLGFLAHVTGEPRRIVLVGNEHVLYRNLGRRVAQPTEASGRWVARVIGSGDVANASVPRVDAACAELLPGMRYAPRIHHIGVVRGTQTVGAQQLQDALAAGLQGYPVQKSGMRTGRTVGFVEDVHVQVPTAVPPCEVVDLPTQLEIAPPDDDPQDLTRSGDSGSAWLTRATRVDGFTVPSNHLVGLSFAGGGQHAYASHIQAVLTELGIEPCTTDTENALADGAQSVVTPIGGASGDPWYLRLKHKLGRD